MAQRIGRVSRSDVPGLRKNEASTGVAVSDSSSEPVSAKMTVSAIGRNIFPSTPCKRQDRQVDDRDDRHAEDDRPPDLQRRARGRRRACVAFGPACASRLTQFSITITALSTIRPKSMAPRLIRLPAMPKASIRLPAKSIDSGIARRDDQPGPQVAQEDQQDHDDQHAPLGQVVSHRVDRLLDQVAAVVERVDDDPLGQRLLDLLDLLLDPVDDHAAVLAGEQLDDRRDGLAAAVAGRGPLADHRREADRADVADVDRRPARGGGQDHLLQCP